MTVYSEIDSFACAWLRNLIAAGHIAPGNVVEGDMRSVPIETWGGSQRSHFFAGIGVWDYALRLAGWPDDVPVWTGSCPCQPFSTAENAKLRAVVEAAREVVDGAPEYAGGLETALAALEEK